MRVRPVVRPRASPQRLKAIFAFHAAGGTPADTLKTGSWNAGKSDLQRKVEINMRKIILFGATAVVLSLGAANAFAMGGGGNLSPEELPYALIAPQTLGPAGTNEGRSVYVSPDVDNGAAATNDNATRHRRHQRRQDRWSASLSVSRLRSVGRSQGRHWALLRRWARRF